MGGFKTETDFNYEGLEAWAKRIELENVKAVLKDLVGLSPESPKTVRFRIDTEIRSVADSTSPSSRSFGLYLRPFSTDTDEKVFIARGSALCFAPWQLAIAMSAHSLSLPPLLGIESVDYRELGLSRSEDWQNRIKWLAWTAEYIVVLPGPSQGTMWEVDLIQREGLLEKCVWIMPAHTLFKRSRWHRIKRQALELGLTFPDRHSRPCLFRLDRSGELDRLVTLPEGLTVDSGSAALRSIFSEGPIGQPPRRGNTDMFAFLAPVSARKFWLAVAVLMALLLVCLLTAVG